MYSKAEQQIEKHETKNIRIFYDVTENMFIFLLLWLQILQR